MNDHNQQQGSAEVSKAGEYDHLLDPATLARWTAERQRQHLDDATVYGDVHATVQAAVRADKLDGDHLWAHRRRAKKVEKHTRRLARAARAQAKAAERLRTAYVEHRATVEALPGQRKAKKEAKEARRAQRGTVRDRIEQAATRSLGASSATPQVNPADTSPFGVPSPQQGAQPGAPGVVLRGISDAWQKGA